MSAVLLAACAAAPVPPPPQPSQVDAKRQAEFDKSLERWHGAPVKELLAKLGMPDSKSRLADGSSTYVYAKSATLRGPAGPVRFSCVVRYVIDERSERVTGHRIEGC